MCTRGSIACVWLRRFQILRSAQRAIGVILLRDFSRSKPPNSNLMPTTFTRKRQGTITPVATWVAGALFASCAQLVAGQDDGGDSEARVNGSDAGPTTEADATDDTLRTDTVVPTTFQPSYRLILNSYDDGSPTGRATLFAATIANPPPNAQDRGSERVVDQCIVRRNVGWIPQNIGTIRLESVFGSAEAPFDAGPLQYSALLAERTLPAESLVTVLIAASDGFSAARLSVAQPGRVEPIYPSALESRTPAPLDLALPIRWQPIESRFSLLIDLRQTIGNTRVSVSCSVPASIGAYTLPPEVIAAIDRNSGKSITVGLSDLAVGTVRGVQTRFYSQLVVASISDYP